MKRRRIAKGVYQDQYGYSVRWRDRGRPRERRFPLDTPNEILKAFRKRQAQQAQSSPRERDGSVVRDIVRFLRTRKGRPSFKSDRAHLRPWAIRFRHLSRWHLTREHIIAALVAWHQDGYAPRELKHRLAILAQLFRHFAPDQPTPCDRIPLPQRIEKPRPIAVSDALVCEVALQLRKAELVGRLRTMKTRARYLVLAATGQRAAQLKRAQPFDVDLEHLRNASQRACQPRNC